MGQDSDILALLSAVDLFHGLGPAELSGAAALMRRQEHEAGSVVMRQLPLKLILQYRVLPLSLDGTVVRLGIVDPSDVIARQSAAAFLHRHEIEWVCLAASDFDHFRDKRLHELTASAALGAEIPEE